MIRLVLLALLLSACTASVWRPETTSDRVTGLHLNQDTQQLVVTTRNDAFVFPIEENFREAMALTRQHPFHPKFSDFQLDDQNNISGTVSLIYHGRSQNPVLLQRLAALGFRLLEGPQQYRQLDTRISGKRYLVEGELPLERLEREYFVRIAQPIGGSPQAGRIIATPAAITVDAVVTAPAAFLSFLVMSVGSANN